MRSTDLFALLMAGPRPAPPPAPADALPMDGPYDCQACGACCVEAGAVVVRAEDVGVPRRLTRSAEGVRDARAGDRQMAKHLGGRCKALEGEIGSCVGCAIYDRRPGVCARFEPGSESCRFAREWASRKMRPESGTRRGYGPDWRTNVRP